MKRIGLKVQDIEIGKKAYYYAYADEYSNSGPKECVITSKPYEVCGSFVCWIDINSSCVSLDNLSFNYYKEQKLSSKKRKAKERYAKWINADGEYDGIPFVDYIKYQMYK